MSTAILPDDSVVIRLARETIHLCAKTRAIHVRAAHPTRDLGGSMLASYPLAAAERVRLTKGDNGRVRLVLELRSGSQISLGDAPSQDVGMLTARVIADLTRCKVEVGAGEVQDLPGPRAIEEPTNRIPWEDDTVPPAFARPGSGSGAGPRPRAAAPRAGSVEAPWAQQAYQEMAPIEAIEEPTPVFGELLRESQIAAAESPEHLPTQIGMGGWRGRSSSATRRRAIFEMLRLTSESLPVARISLADFTLP